MQFDLKLTGSVANLSAFLTGFSDLAGNADVQVELTGGEPGEAPQNAAESAEIDTLKQMIAEKVNTLAQQTGVKAVMALSAPEKETK